MRRVAVIEVEDAQRYRKTLWWVQRRLEAAFENTTDKQLRKVINKHGPVIDELLDELK
jgi:hypothetical protein